MKTVAVTGGIGSGKSTVCKFFEHLGIPIYNSDYQAKRLMSQNEQVKAKIIDAFSLNSYCEGGLNTQFLAKEVFSSKEKLTLLNSIVHPALLTDFRSWVATCNSPYVIMESAIVLDIGWRENVDIVICVVCDEKTRIERVVERDGLTVQMAEQRIKNQMTDEQRVLQSDYIINSGDGELIITQILLIDKQLKKV